MSPRTAASGKWELSSSVLWSNSFSWTQDEPGETPKDRRFLVDGETAIVDLMLRRGLTGSLDAAVRLPLLGRGGGVLDAFIDAWHRLANLPDGRRPEFVTSAFRVEGRTSSGGRFSWNGDPGWGLGALELELRYRATPLASDGAQVALVGRARLPTGTGPYSGGGFGAAGQVVVDAPIGGRVDFFSGLGMTAQDPSAVRGIEYEPARLHGFLGFEWRAARPLSLVVETNAASRLVRNVDRYPGTHWVVNIGGRLDLGQRTRLDAFVTENIKSQLSTTDFALYLGLSLRP